MSDLIEEVVKTTLTPKQQYLVLECCVNGPDGEEVDIPSVRFKRQ